MAITNNIDIYLEYLAHEEFNIDSVNSAGSDLYHHAKELGHTAAQHVTDAGQKVAQHATDPTLPSRAGQAAHDFTAGPAGKLAFGGLAGLAAYKLAKAAGSRLRGR